MSDRLLNLPTLRIPARGVLALAGRFLAFLAWLVLVVLLAALRLVMAVFLRLLRPFILTGLFLTIIGGIGTTAVFGFWHHWHDAMQSALVTVFSATVFVLYSWLATIIDPQHFEQKIPAWWWRY